MSLIHNTGKTAKLEKKILALHNKGLSGRKIGKIIGVSNSTISKFLRKRNIKRNFNQVGGTKRQYIGNISVPFFNEIKYKAKQRNIEFKINIKYLDVLYQIQKGKCSLSGKQLKFDSGQKIYDGNISLDRKDSSKGYIKGNVQFVDKTLNMMKQTLPQEEFINRCKQVAKHNE